MTVAVLSRSNEPAHVGQSAKGIEMNATRIAQRSWGLKGVSVKYCLSATNITRPRRGNEIVGVRRDSATVKIANCAQAPIHPGRAR
jgi:hypothetical protein